MKKMTIQERFFEKVEIKSEDGCWFWIGAKQGNGYGNFKNSNKYMLAHRYSYELHKSGIPEGLMVLHKCDNRRCVNPSHLFLGTAKDNTVDMMNKGRCGGYKNAKLSIEDKKTARHLYFAECKTQSEIARHFNVSSSAIHYIIYRKNWINDEYYCPH
jgi:hypothetical protein